MATFYLDYEGGNDANDGTTFANRWKTFASGATSARTAPGDTIRIMASPDPTLVGSATWTQDSKTVTLGSAVTADITDCGTAWTASANVTATTTSTRKEGTLACSLAVAAGFTTGKIAYFATGTLDLSAYQQVSFWIRGSAAISASVLSLRLCSDTAGDTVVDTIAIPAIAPTTSWTPVTVDTGGALGSAIASISIAAASDPGTITILLDNIIACKASSSADSLTLTSLIGKDHNLYWQASTAYASNAIRRPTPPNFTGFQYKVTAGGGGNSGGTEPTWPQYIGGTVSDGALTWTCEELQDTWYALQSIRGTTLLIDNDNSTLANAGRGYPRSSGTVDLYKRETIKTGISSAGAIHTAQESGSVSGGLITYSGGWNRTDMSTMTGETWMDNQSRSAVMYNASSLSYIKFRNLHAVRCDRLVTLGTGSYCYAEYCQGGHCTNGGTESNGNRLSMFGVTANNNFTNGIDANAPSANLLSRIVACSNLGPGIIGSTDNGQYAEGADWLCANNGSYGVDSIGVSRRPVYRVVTRGNATAGIRSTMGNAYYADSSFTDSTPIAAVTDVDVYIYSHRHGQTANSHLITTQGATIAAATDQRHTASGISWKFSITSTARSAYAPVQLSVGKVFVASGATKTISIWVRRDSTDIKGQLRVAGGQVPGEEVDITTAAEPSINTWTQYSLNVSPTEDGVFEIMFDCWDGVGTTNNLWVDDLGVA